MTFDDWLANVLESAVDSCTFGDPTRNPLDIVVDIETEIIQTFGFNLNHIQIKESHS